MNSFVVDRCDFSPGDNIGNHYKVRKTLGEGSFGMVYLVNDPVGQLFALKLLRLWEVPSDIRQPLVDRFEMEFKTGQIECDNLVRSLDYGMAGGNPYIVMEYCTGGDLTPYLGTHTKQVPTICQQILTGLNALHSRGKVHRDLKPENVLFKRNGAAALTDFGISGDRNNRMTQRNIFGKPNQIFGTYAYMPPEQVTRMRGGATVLPTTDIFSFGVLAFQLLTGLLPFGELETHNDLAEYQRRAKNGEWNHQQLSFVPNGHEWERVISGCLVPDYRQRLQSTVDVFKMIPLTDSQRHNNYPASSIQQRIQYQRPYDLPYPPRPILPTGGIQQNSNSSNSINLQVLQGVEYNRVYCLTDLFNKHGRILTIGRGSENSITIRTDAHSRMSRNHCTIEVSEDGKQFSIRDGQWMPTLHQWKESSNGTFVNSRPITKAGWFLKQGDIITLGDTTLKFY